MLCGISKIHVASLLSCLERDFWTAKLLYSRFSILNDDLCSPKMPQMMEIYIDNIHVKSPSFEIHAFVLWAVFASLEMKIYDPQTERQRQKLLVRYLKK